MPFTPIDLVALIIFASFWVGYACFADGSNRFSQKSLVQVMHEYRQLWMWSMIRREDRLVDVRIIGNLLKTATFFASTSILIIAGFISMMAYGDQALSVIAYIDFYADNSRAMWVWKNMLPLTIFMYSFFKLTWVIRQFNYVTILIMAAPFFDGKSKKEEAASYVDKTSRILSNAARHFNASIRSYYFGLVSLSWFISPLIFMMLSVLVVIILYRREFMSRTLEEVRRG